MKKILLGTTAVVALGAMSAEAFAADPISLSLGGFMRQYVAVTDSDEVAPSGNNPLRATDLAQWSNTEVYFSGSTTLDNGLTVAAHIELEADNGATDNIDRNYLTVSSDAMGALTLGSAPHAIDDFRVGAPNAGNFDWTDTDGLANVARTATGTTETVGMVSSSDVTNFGNDTVKIKYVSPTLADMVTVFASYAAADADTHNGQNLTRGNGGTNQDVYSYGVALSGEFSGAAVDAMLGYYSNDNDNIEEIQGGVSVSMAGFTIGGSYADFSDTRTGSNVNDGKGWDLGVGYQTGPYALTARYMQAKNKGSAATAGDNKDTRWAVDATYSLGAGVSLAATYFNTKADPEGATTSADVSGVLAGIEVAF